MPVDNPKPGRQASGVTNLIDMSEREYFAQFAKRTGMFIGHTTLDGVTAFMDGYGLAANRHGGPGLDGWREWLMANHKVSQTLAWQAQIRLIALPDLERLWDLTPEQEAHVIRVLFELFDTFLAEREGAASGS
ncbi:hypothetical protein [Streptomyces sp. NPDC041003]|uniref:hypothetical protein n=1 Tax=Streptomyces sp. NPDC041003 TaxID=3155730 RepID=UPI0033DBB9CF